MTDAGMWFMCDVTGFKSRTPCVCCNAHWAALVARDLRNSIGELDRRTATGQDLISVADLPGFLGVSDRTARNRLRESGIEIHVGARDRRQKYITWSDFHALRDGPSHEA